jgi:hypothetical protein
VVGIGQSKGDMLYFGVDRPDHHERVMAWRKAEAGGGRASGPPPTMFSPNDDGELSSEVGEHSINTYDAGDPASNGDFDCTFQHTSW